MNISKIYNKNTKTEYIPYVLSFLYPQICVDKKTNACTKIKIESIIKGRRSDGCTKGGRKTA